MSTWKGVSHARMTRSMHTLRGGEFKVLAAIRRLIPDGERRKLSQAEIAAKAKVSEGTVSAAMKTLNDVYLKRHFLGRGRGKGYEIEMLPPPEQQLPLPLDTPRKGSDHDLFDRTFSDGSGTPQTPPQKSSESDPFIFLDHAHEQQQQRGGVSTAADAVQTRPAGQLASETIAALVAAGAHPKLIQRVATANPGCTPADVAAALAAATIKPNAHTPPGLALECLASNQAVVLPRPRLEPSPPEEVPKPRLRGRAAPPGEEPNEQLRAALKAQLAPSPAPTRPAPAGTRLAPDLHQRWQAAQGLLRNQLAAGEFDTWLRRLDLAELAAGVATLVAPSAEIAEGALRRHGATIRRVLGDLVGTPVQLRIVAATPAAD